MSQQGCWRDILAVEELLLSGAGPACWLWDYLRRSGAAGYMLPLSGGADSSATATIVGNMCQMVVRAVQHGDKAVEAEARRWAQEMPGALAVAVDCLLLPDGGDHRQAASCGAQVYVRAQFAGILSSSGVQLGCEDDVVKAEACMSA